MLKQRAGIDMTHINYNGSAPALTDVIAGRVPLMFDIWHSAKRYVDAGELKLIAAVAPSACRTRPMSRRWRKPIPDFEVIAFNAHGGAGRHAAADRGKNVGRYPRRRRAPRAFAEKTKHLGINAYGNTPGELDAWMRGEIARWQEIAKAANIKAE